MIHFSVIEAKGSDSNQAEDDVIDQLATNFEKADEIVPEEIRIIPDESLNEIKEDLSDKDVIKDKLQPKEPVEPTSQLDIDTILLITVGSVAEAAFIGATVYFICRRNRTVAVLAISFSILIRKSIKSLQYPTSFTAILGVVGYYWMIEEISRELGMGLVISSSVVAILFAIIVAVSMRRRATSSRISSSRDSISMTDWPRSANPYQIN